MRCQKVRHHRDYQGFGSHLTNFSIFIKYFDNQIFSELMMLDEQTQQALQQQLNEQFNLQPGGPVMGNDISKPIATTLSSMLLQPIVTSSSLQYAFMRQQQHQVYTYPLSFGITSRSKFKTSHSVATIV
jgi:hypothetical protein